MYVRLEKENFSTLENGCSRRLLGDGLGRRMRVNGRVNLIFVINAAFVFVDTTMALGVNPEDQETQIKKLIDQLVSPNPPPTVDYKVNRRGYETPNGYDSEAQRAVLAARKKLVELGPVAFPQLLERWTDDRYCRSTCSALSGGWQNVTVGNECRTIIFDQLQPYGYWQRTDSDPRGKTARPSCDKAFFDTQDNAKEWWGRHQEKSLREMQLTIANWIVSEESKRPDDFSDRERTHMKRIRDQLANDTNPLKSGNFYWTDREEHILGSPKSKK